MVPIGADQANKYFGDEHSKRPWKGPGNSMLKKCYVGCAGKDSRTFK